MVLAFALCLSLILTVSFEKTSTGVIAAVVWALISLVAFQSPAHF